MTKDDFLKKLSDRIKIASEQRDNRTLASCKKLKRFAEKCDDVQITDLIPAQLDLCTWEEEIYKEHNLPSELLTEVNEYKAILTNLLQ